MGECCARPIAPLVNELSTLAAGETLTEFAAMTTEGDFTKERCDKLLVLATSSDGLAHHEVFKYLKKHVELPAKLVADLRKLLSNLGLADDPEVIVPGLKHVADTLDASKES